MSQEQQIKHYLQSGNRITPIDALNKFNCFRLSARILSLKESGLPIKSRIKHENGKRFAEYWI